MTFVTARTLRRLSALLRGGVVGAALLAGSGCEGADDGNASPGDDQARRCTEIIDKLKECYPDLETEGKCTAETVVAFDSSSSSTVAPTRRWP